MYIVCFASMGVIFEFVKSWAESGLLSRFAFVLITSAIFVIGWMAAFMGAKSLKNKATKKEQLDNMVDRFHYDLVGIYDI